MINLFNHHIFVQFLKENEQSTNPIHKGDIAEILRINDFTQYTNSKGFVIPAFFPQHLTQPVYIQPNADDNNINVKATNSISKCYVVRYSNINIHKLPQDYDIYNQLISHSPSRFFPIIKDILTFENGYFVYNSTDRQIAEYEVNKGVHEDLKNADYSLQDFSFGYNKRNIPAVPIHPLKHDTEWINYYSSTLSYFISNINFNINKLTIQQPTEDYLADYLVLYFTDEQNRLFAVTYLYHEMVNRLKNNQYSVNIKYIHTKDRLDPLLTDVGLYNTATPNQSSIYNFKVITDIDQSYYHIDRHDLLNKIFHLSITKSIDGSVSDNIDEKYVQTLESIRTIPSQLKDTKKRTFIDNHNYLYAHNSNVNSIFHYNYTFIPPKIEDVRQEYATTDNSIVIPDFIIKDLNAERPDIKYLYVVGSEPELNDFKQKTEMYIMNYRNSYSVIFPDNKGYDVLKTKLKVLNGSIGNAYTITYTDNTNDENPQSQPSLLLQKLNKEVNLNSFREDVDTIKDYLIDKNIMSRVNAKGELNFFKVIGFIKDGAYYVLANYHYGTEQDVNNNIIKKGDDFDNLNFICYSIALDFYPRLNNVVSAREKTPLEHNNLALMTSKRFYNGVNVSGTSTSTYLNTVTFKVNGNDYTLHNLHLLNDNLKMNDPVKYVSGDNYTYNTITSYTQMNKVKDSFQYLTIQPMELRINNPVIIYFTNDKYSVTVVNGKDVYNNDTYVASNYSNFWDNSTTENAVINTETYNKINAVGNNGYKVFHHGLNVYGNSSYGRMIYYYNGENLKTSSNEYINNGISNSAFEKNIKLPALATINTFNDSLINTITLGMGNTPSGTDLIQTQIIIFKYADRYGE